MTPDEIRARHQRLQVAIAELKAAKESWGEVEDAVDRLIRRNASITGRGNRRSPYPGDVRLRGGMLRVKEMAYYGEGIYEHHYIEHDRDRLSYFRLPIEWLSMPPDEVSAAIREEHDRRLEAG